MGIICNATKLYYNWFEMSGYHVYMPCLSLPQNAFFLLPKFTPFLLLILVSLFASFYCPAIAWTNFFTMHIFLSS